MRAFLPLTLLLLAGCGGTDDGRSGVVTNILDQTVPNASQAAPPDNAITPVEPPSGPPAPRADAGAPLIPVAAQGRWTGPRDACGDKAAALELTVTRDSLVFHESEGKATMVRTLDDGRIAVDAAFTGEGESWTRTVLLDPSADGTRLTVVNDGTAATRKRCAS